MSATFISDPAFTILIQRDHLDVASILAGPQIASGLCAASNVFVRAILRNGSAIAPH